MQPEEHAALEEFGGRFQNVKFYKGMPLSFITSGHGKLIIRIDEKEVCAVRLLCGLWQPICKLDV